MKLNRISVSIEPGYHDPKYAVLKVMVKTNGIEHYSEEPFDFSSFESEFDQLVERGKRRLRDQIKKHQ